MKDFGIALSMRRHSRRKGVENEKLDPGAGPLKSSLAEHLLHKMSEGGIVPENQDEEHMESDADGDDFLASNPEQLEPEEQGMDQHQVDTYPASHEFEDKRKKLSAAFASMANHRRKG